MKVISLLLIAFFLVGSLELPASASVKPAMRSCCCKVGVCHCKHNANDICPMQNHFSKTNSSPYQLIAHCGFKDEKAVSSVYTKECVVTSFAFLPRLKRSFLIAFIAFQHLPFLKFPIELPPRLVSF